MNISKFQLLLIICLSFFVSHICVAEDWMNWRGPAYNGTAEARNLPVSWSTDGKKENVVWARKLDGLGRSTPIIVGDYIFITVSIEEDRNLYAICINRNNGKIIWRKQLGKGRKNPRNNMASPSAVSDGKHVFFLFGQGTFAALDLKGKLIWKRELEKDYEEFTIKYVYSSSPLLYNGKLFVPILRRYMLSEKTPAKTSKRKRRKQKRDKPIDSLVIAFDPATGKTLWKQVRDTEAIEESRDSYTTPVIYQYGKNIGIIISGADVITCHHPDTGKELWRYPYTEEREIMWRLVPTPIVMDDLICFTIPRGDEIFVIKPYQNNFNKTPELVWHYEGPIPDVCSPSLYKGLLYVLDGRKKILTCFEPSNGKIVWQKKLECRAKFYASPTIADEKIYCISLKGDVFVLSAGKKSKLLSKFSIGKEECPASIAVSDNSLFIRTPTRLICVKKMPK